MAVILKIIVQFKLCLELAWKLLDIFVKIGICLVYGTLKEAIYYIIPVNISSDNMSLKNALLITSRRVQ